MSIRAPYLLACLLLAATPASSEWGEPVNLGPPINTSNWQYCPSISSDGMRLYYAHGSDDLFVTTWEDTAWGLPVDLGPNVNTLNRELSPSISSDDTELYFVSYARPGGYGSYDIWVSTWEDTMWGPAVNVGPNVNTPYIEWSANISFDGKKLYFASDRLGTHGDTDIWVSEWDSINSEWGPAANLGWNVNTVGREYWPSVSADGSALYFAAWGGAGVVDIYCSQWEDTIWGPAVNLGAPINTDVWEDGPSISADGTKLYFAARFRPGGEGDYDIWVSEWVPGVQEEERPKRSKEEVSLTCLPNPFSSAAVIRYSVPESGHVSLRIYDAAGRLVRSLVDGIEEPGTQEVSWDGANDGGEALPSGIYFCRLEAGGHAATSKLQLAR